MRKLGALAVVVALVVLAWWCLAAVAGAGRAAGEDATGVPVVGFESATYAVGEGEGSATISVRLDAATMETVTVGYATHDGLAVAGADYVTASGALTFTPGVVSRAFDVPILDDGQDEADETLNLVLTGPWNGTLGALSAATLVVLDDDGQPSVGFGAQAYSVRETAGDAAITVTLGNPYSRTVTVGYATSDGTARAGVDYVTASGRLTFTPGVTSLHFSVTVLDDALYERSETVNLALNAPVSGTLGWFRSARLHIVDGEVYMPLLTRYHSAVYSYSCPLTSSHTYAGGTAEQVEMDDPVRPAYEHADKNIALRGYTPNTDPGLKRELVDYGSDDPTQPPQLATIFYPYRVPVLSAFYQIHQWDWADSPEPGTRAEPETNPPVTALGMEVRPGEPLRVPRSGYDIGGYEVLVLFADEDTVALKYAREDSAGSEGYTVHMDNICTDPALLVLYNRLDDPGGARYVYVPQDERPHTYELPMLGEEQVVGTARDTEVVVAIVDSGWFMDTRSCNEWWQIRPDYEGTCPGP